MKNFIKLAISYISQDGHLASEIAVKLLKEVNYSACDRHMNNKSKNPMACQYLDQAISAPNSIELARSLFTIKNQLIWSEAPKGKLTSFMDDRHAMVQMIGPDALYYSEKVRFGAFLLAPDTIYPLHSHAAEEIYLPISGVGEWRFKKQPYSMRQPGAIIHCESWTPHALRTGKKPVLMLWAWFGTTDFTAYRFEPNAYGENGKPL